MSTTPGITEITLPSFDTAMEEGTVISWHVSVGDTVRAGQIIAEIETEKATVDLEAPADGIIVTIEVPEGHEPVHVGTTLARLRTVAPQPDSSVDTNGSARPNKTPAGDAETIDAAARQLEPQTEDEADAVPGLTDIPPSDPPPKTRTSASPRARRLARERGLKLSEIVGSGPRGRIVARDLEAVDTSESSSEPHLEEIQRQEPEPSSTSPKLTSYGIEPGTYRLEPLSGMRKTIARRMTEGFREAPNFSLSVDINLEGVMQRRRAINSSLEESNTTLSINDFMVWAASAALTDVPEANVSFTDEGIALHEHANIAVAIATDGGLVAPVVHAADTKTVEEIASEIRLLVDKSRARKLGRADLDGGTFTVSNLGMYGIRSFSSVLTPPQACVLSVGAAERRPRLDDSEHSVATFATVTLTCDHRAVDGVIGARFLSAFRKHLETIASADDS